MLKNYLMNGLLISPRAVINASNLAALLAVGDASEERQLLTELLQGYPQRFEAILDEIIPDFSLSFDAPSGDTARQEALTA
jgi:hypothetical protein